MVKIGIVFRGSQGRHCFHFVFSGPGDRRGEGGEVQRAIINLLSSAFLNEPQKPTSSCCVQALLCLLSGNIRVVAMESFEKLVSSEDLLSNLPGVVR